MTDEILSDRDLEAFIGSLKLIPSKGGVFELVVNGELLFSKKALDRHANPGELKALVVAELDKVKKLPK